MSYRMEIARFKKQRHQLEQRERGLNQRRFSQRDMHIFLVQTYNNYKLNTFQLQNIIVACIVLLINQNSN